MSENETTACEGWPGQGQAEPSAGESLLTVGDDGSATGNAGLVPSKGVNLAESDIAPTTLCRMRAQR